MSFDRALCEARTLPAVGCFFDRLTPSHGEVGTILGRHGVNIASFALGRGADGAIGVVNVDEDATAPQKLDGAVEALRKVPAIREAWVVRLT